jgi:hypothetical protein
MLNVFNAECRYAYCCNAEYFLCWLVGAILNVIMLTAVMLNVITLTAVMLNVVELNVVAPTSTPLIIENELQN